MVRKEKEGNAGGAQGHEHGAAEEGEGGEADGLHMYKLYFEDEFLKRTEAFYRAEAEQFLAHNTVSDYTRKVEARLKEEELRADTHLHSSTKSALLGVCTRVLIDNLKDRFADEFVSMLKQNATADLRTLHQLMRVNQEHRLRERTLGTHSGRPAALAAVDARGSGAARATQRVDSSAGCESSGSAGKSLKHLASLFQELITESGRSIMDCKHGQATKTKSKKGDSKVRTPRPRVHTTVW